MARHGLAWHNVVAELKDLDEGRGGVTALGRAGFEADDISVLGPGREKAAQELDTWDRERRLVGDVAEEGRDRRCDRHDHRRCARVARWRPGVRAPGRRARPGFGDLGDDAPRSARRWGVGGMLGGFHSMDVHEDWELTYESVRDGKVLLALHADRKEDAEHASQVLHDAGSVRLLRFYQQGRAEDDEDQSS